ncbi:MAG: DUF3465 domain-containing protein [Planctomycetota bacterium]|nr:DUF3465 domain-containing protein [Planctomycetota bacterium]
MYKRAPTPREFLLGLLIVAAVAAWHYWGPESEKPDSGPSGIPPVQELPSTNGDGVVADNTRTKPYTRPSGEAEVLKAFRAKRSDVQVEVEGTVVFLFPPDRDDKPHQRFLLKLPSGHTLKIAHNLKFSGPIPLKKGDTVRLYGEYEYNAKGGVVHWTHRDPANRHPHGWIRHKGEIYR